jgi:hypothetical protein
LAKDPAALEPSRRQSEIFNFPDFRGSRIFYKLGSLSEILFSAKINVSNLFHSNFKLLKKVGPADLVSNSDEIARDVIGWSSLFFALLQSICTFFLALSGLRFFIGVGSLAMSASIPEALEKFHADWIRIPMMALALLGSLLNLAVLMQVRALRNRPASRWRQLPLNLHKIRMERAQWILSFATLLLIGIEEYLHFSQFHKP